jgi:hypothetical protein
VLSNQAREYLLKASQKLGNRPGISVG